MTSFFNRKLLRNKQSNRLTIQPKLSRLEDRCNPVLGNPAWVEIGPGPIADASRLLGGTVTTAGSVHSSDILAGKPDVAVVAATSGGIWRTENFTSDNPNWVSITDASRYLFTSDVAFDPLDTSGNTVYASLGQFSSYGSSTASTQFPTGTGTGFYKITAARSNNPTVELLSPTVFNGLRIWEIQPTSIVAPGAGQVVLASTDAGLFRSTDAGTNWEKVATIPSDDGAGNALPTTELIPDPLDKSTFYAAVPTKGVFISKDAGATWTGVRTDQLVGLAETKLINVAVHHKGSTVVAYGMLVAKNNATTILRYTQDNDTWTPLSSMIAATDDGGKIRNQVEGPYGGAVAADPSNPNIVYVGADRHFVGDASKPDGQQWTFLRGKNVANTHAHDDARSFRFDAAGNLISTNDGGIARLSNPLDPTTRKWTTLSSDLRTVEFYPSIAWDSYNHVFTAGTQDNGTHRQDQFGKFNATVIEGGDGGITRIDNTSEPGKSTVYFSAQEWAGFTRQTFDATGKSISRVEVARNVLGTGKNILQIATPAFIQQYSLNQVDAKRILTGVAGQLFESFDQGDNFARIDLTGLGIKNLGASVTGGRSKGADNPDVAYIVGDDGTAGVVLVRTTANGPFTKTAYPGVGFDTTADAIAIDPDDWRRVYVVAGDGKIWQSFDAGANWKDISPGISSVRQGNNSTIVVYPRTTAAGDEVIFIGGYASDAVFDDNAGSGIFSYDLSDANPTWAQFGKSIPRVAITDLDYNATDNILIASTTGRGAYAVPLISDVAGVPSPVLDLNGAAAGKDFAATFTQGKGAVTLLDPAGSITGTTSANVASAKIFIANFRPQDNETLAVDVTGTAIAASKFQNGFLTLSGTDTKENYEKVLRTLNYNNTDAVPNTTARIVRVRVFDGTTNSNEATTTVTVVAVNNAPIVDLNGPDAGTDFTTKFQEGGAPIAITSKLATLTDVDSPNLNGALVTITNPLDGANELLTADVTGTAITAAYVPATGKLTLTGTDTPANYEKVLGTIQYRNVSQNANRITRVIQVTASDGPNTSAEAVSRIDILAANNAPVLDASMNFQLAAIPADAGQNKGTTVFAMLESIAPPNRITDADPGDLRGVAIISATSPNGSWEFSKDGGTSWRSLAAMTESDARLLSDKMGNLVRFVPNAGFNGKATLQFRAWDGSGRLGIENEDGERRSTTPNGGRTPFSTAIGTAEIVVGAPPQPPTPTANFVVTAQTENEDRGTDVVVSIQLSEAAPQDLAIQIGFTGDAILNDPAIAPAVFDYTIRDFQVAPFTVQILQGQSKGSFSVTIFDDNLAESTEKAIFTIDPASAGIIVGTKNTYTLSILDNDTPVDKIAPTAKLGNAANVDDNSKGATAYDFTVVYSDNVALDASSFDGQDIRITGPNNFNTVAAFVKADVAGDGTPRTATYRITPPGGTWDFADSGTYTLTIEANQVQDTNSNKVAAGTLGTFTVTVSDVPPADTTAPTATLGTAAAVGNSAKGATSYEFTVVYSDNVAVDAASFDNSDIRVTGPNSFNTLATFVSAAPAGNGTPRTSTYRITPPGGSWDFADNGTYTIAIEANQVVDTSANKVATGNLGTITVNVAAPAVPLLVGFPQFAAATDAKGNGSLQFYNADKTPRLADPIFPFGNFTGGIRTVTADFNADGIADIVVGTGPGRATRVLILDGANQSQLFAVDPFEAAFTGGVYVAAGDINGDGVPELVITPDEGGGPRARVFNGKGFAVLADFFGIADPNFRGGARAGIGDINGDGFGDLVVAAGFGGGPRTSTYDGSKLTVTGGPTLFGDFFAFEESLRNGTFVSVGDTDGDGKAEMIIGAGPGGGPRVSAFSAVDLLVNKQTRIADFFAGDTNSRGGVRVAVKNLDGDNRADVIAGAGVGSGNRVTAYAGKNLIVGNSPELYNFDAFPGLNGGIFVG